MKGWAMTMGLVLAAAAWSCSEAPSDEGCDDCSSAGSGGAAGTAGSAPVRAAAGAGGDAGAGGTDSFAPQCAEPLEFKSECSFEDTCTALGCGDGLSPFGKDGCRRFCSTSDDCGVGERCRYTTLVTNEEECVTGSEVEVCSYQDGECACSITADCIYPSICVDAAQYPASLDCVLEGASCTALAYLHGNLTYELEQEPVAEFELPASECLAAVEDKQAELDCAN
jgi:hypothetical protein